MWGVSVTAVMVSTEFLEVGLNTVNKAAMNRGLSNFVLVLYSNIFGIFILAPCIFIFYRKRSPPLLTWSTICKILVLGVLSYGGQICTYIGLGYASPTLASAMADLTPAFTFIFSIISRMEKLDLGIKSSQAKSVGTLVSIFGALVVTLYKGLPLFTTYPSKKRLIDELLLIPQSNWIVGGFFLASHSVIFAIILNVQYHRRHPILCCLFDRRERHKCMETWTEYGVNGYCIHGSFRRSIPKCGSQMGFAQERAYLCFHVQAT
ncbi:hypothetical protein PTKIN_Ptkin02bG0089800 [Pterospermum kingtungense]